MTARILALDHTAALGGAELSLLDVADGLRPDVRVALFADGPLRAALAARGIDAAVLPMGALGAMRKESRVPSPAALLAAWRLAGAIGEHAGDARVLYANSQKSFVAAALASMRSGRPVVWHLRDLLGPPHFSALNTRGVVALANWRAARVIANSRATADAFVAAGGRAGLVRVVHNGIAPAPFDAVSAAQASALRAQLSPAARYVWAVFGRLHAWKGQHIAIEALAQGAADAHLWIVGAPLFGERDYEASLRTLAQRLGVADRVHFLGFRDDVAALMRAADLVAHTSTLPEPFGRVLVEGMLAQRPVVAADAGGVREIIADGQTGLLVPPGDAAALARVIAALRADAPRAASIAAAAAAYARQAFSVDAMVRGVRAIIDEVAV